MRTLSPAQKLLARKLAAQAIAHAPLGLIAAERADEGPEANAYALLREQMGEHLRQLKDTASTEGKVRAKLDMLADYDDHIDTVILTAESEGKALQDEVFVRLMIWHFDCAALNVDLYPRAFEMAEHVLKFGLTLPENFKRSVAALITEFVADAALNAITLADADDLAPFDLEILRRVEALTDGHDMVDIVKSKLHKAYGLLFVRLAKKIDAGATDGPAGGARAARIEALTHLKRALELNKNIGVKKEIADMERALAKPDA